MYVITNGNTYITKSRSGKVGKTSNILLLMVWQKRVIVHIILD